MPKRSQRPPASTGCPDCHKRARSLDERAERNAAETIMTTVYECESSQCVVDTFEITRIVK